jgi:hypothetical protein
VGGKTKQKEVGKMARQKFWMGIPPTHCQLCQYEFRTHFIDAKTIHGPWGFLCEECHENYGHGFGLGKGQRYHKQEDGRWLKVTG